MKARPFIQPEEQLCSTEEARVRENFQPSKQRKLNGAPFFFSEKLWPFIAGQNKVF
jgi:hypothetical protein